MIGAVFQRRTTGSVVCPSCGSLVGVRDDKCYMCGRSNPGLWGFGPMLRQVGADLGFVPLVMGASGTIFVLTLLASGNELEISEATTPVGVSGNRFGPFTNMNAFVLAVRTTSVRSR